MKVFPKGGVFRLLKMERENYYRRKTGSDLRVGLIYHIHVNRDLHADANDILLHIWNPADPYCINQVFERVDRLRCYKRVHSCTFLLRSNSRMRLDKSLVTLAIVAAHGCGWVEGAKNREKKKTCRFR